ncbi:FHA domain-containing protein [Lutispora sp.]|uniref:FHA domain-containing protein n=1 Tax=Lutispora sp. TaxID=2828727 RepID=UPI003566B162
MVEEIITDKNKHVLAVYVKNELVSTVGLEEFDKEHITFGRSRENDIIIVSPIVSAKHGVFEKKDGKYFVKDLNSTNGIIVNGSAKQFAELENGDSIRVDDTSNPHNEGVQLIYSILSRYDEEKWVEYPLKDNDVMTIGRDATSSICLTHSSVSKNHARITYRNSACVLEDLNSTNGTYVNGKPVNNKVSLKANDVILIGDTKIIFKGDRLSYSIFSKGLGIDALKVTKEVKEKGGFISKKGTKVLVDGVSISVKPGDLVALIGGSGAGKSTLMDCLNGFRKATGGQVLVNGDDFYSNYEAYKSVLGYVPQQDIVYDTLTVEQMLQYAAMLRMPEDTTAEERKEQVRKVIKSVELEGRENLIIKNLSGGQKKRVSIAVELLADPKLFFLDEPTSGLDPGMERNIMYLLKNLSNTGKTIILVTHAMANLGLCDKIAFMGRGGKLCYFGTPEGALEFFGVRDFADIFNMINSEPAEWQKKFMLSNYYMYHKSLENKKVETSEAKRTRKASIIKQFTIMVRRYAKITWADKQRFFMLLLQAPFIGMLIGMVSAKDSFEIYESSKQVLFTLACSAVWIGVLNSIQEVCKERVVLKREVSVNLRLFPYIMSKVVVLGTLCLIQSIMLTGIVFLFITFPDVCFTGNMLLEVTFFTFLTAMAATSMGLLVSAMVTNSDRAMGLAPLLLIPQILFSGVLFKLEGVTKIISYFAISRWSMAAYGILFDINSLPLRITVENPRFILPERQIEEMFSRSLQNLMENEGVMFLFTVVCLALGIIALKKSLKKS